jgi:hypothetical protein
MYNTSICLTIHRLATEPQIHRKRPEAVIHERLREIIYIVYFVLPDIIRQIKSRRKTWARHVARMGEGRNVYGVLVGKPEEKDHLKDQGVDGRMGSKWTLGRLVGGCGVDSPG